MKKLTTILMVAVIAIMASCSKEGDVGPQGPQGPTGANGANGLQGPKGDTGTANVIYSNWIDANWNVTNNTTSKTMLIPIDESLISYSDLTNKAIVMMYLKQYGTSSIYTMPSAGRWSNTEYDFTFGNNSVGFKGILVNLVSTNGVALTEFQETAFRGNRFRYVIIKGSILGGRLKNPRNMTYDEVCAIYNIPK